MRFAERERYALALQFRAVADPDNVKFLLETRGDPVHGVGHQRACQSVQRAMLFGRALGHERSVFLLEGNPLRQGHRKLSLWSLDFDFAALERNLYAGRHGNWFVPDT